MKKFSLLFALLLAVLPALSALAADPAPAPVLRHAVTCPPFAGDQPIAGVYHDALVEVLKASDGVEYLSGAAATGKRAPKFLYRVEGEVRDGMASIRLVDGYRDEVIAAHSAPATSSRSELAAWCSRVRADLARRVSRIPFECRVEAQPGREALVLDRGLGAGLEPRVTLYVSGEEEVLLDPRTGEAVGRDAPRAYGQIVVYRVNAASAYARPVPGTVLPARGGTFVARSF
ncbi:MAG: hypothetical protein IK066_12655 [Kiritimatiellae bacterium]|nr:hypothetical protein [Kiritimatiellia bacterium]